MTLKEYNTLDAGNTVLAKKKVYKVVSKVFTSVVVREIGKDDTSIKPYQKLSIPMAVPDKM